MIIIELLFSFMKIGAFTFGGGYAMIPLIQKETVENKGWISEEDILEIVSIAESTPGPIAINMATFVGFKTAGFVGAFMATFGVVLPSFLIISLLTFVIDRFSDLKAVEYAFFGIRAGILALIIKALWSMYKACPKGPIPYFIMALAFICVAVFKVNSVYVIIACALVGLISSMIMGREKE